MTRRKINILLIVRSNYHAVLINQELKSRYGFYNDFVCYSLSEAVEILRVRDIKIAVIDLDMFRQDDLISIKNLYIEKPSLLTVGLTSDDSGVIPKLAKEVSIDELVYKDDHFHIVVPKLIHNLMKQNRYLENERYEVEVSEDSEIRDCMKTTAGTLSHEIMNPLMSILGTSELILDEQEKYDSKLIESIKVINDAANRIKLTTQRLTRIEKAAMKKTITGMLVDPLKSRISQDKVAKTTK